MEQENLADIRHKLSIIYKHIQSMRNELRYKAKIHTISEKPSKEKKKKKKKKKKYTTTPPKIIIYV